MKQQTRLEMFETNSSSVHTLQISTKGIQKCKLKISDDGYIHVKLNLYFGNDLHDYTGQSDKLKYICTWMYVYYGCDLERLEDGYEWRKFINAFCEYVNDLNNKATTNWRKKCLGIKVKPVLGDDACSYLDHENQPYSAFDDESCVIDLCRSEDLVNFIFNPNIWLRTRCS